MKYYHPILLFLLLCLTFAWLYLYWHRKSNIGVEEGFQQERAFVSKIGSKHIYDSFYSEIYDDLMLSDSRANNLVDAIIKVSQPTLRYSSFLDVGCGTGTLLQKLNDSGYKATGIDRSHDMIEFCQQKLLMDGDDGRGHIKLVEGDVLDSMQFDRSQFSHIICSDLTLYEWTEQEILRFFRNCYFWTVAGGYLFVHLVNPLQFSPTVLAAKTGALDIPRQRITDTEIDFPAFTYKSTFDFDKGAGAKAGAGSSCGCTRRETFIDLQTQHVRENEMNLHFFPIETIVSMALRSGFVVKAQWNLAKSPYADSHQYIYMFERTL